MTLADFSALLETSGLPVAYRAFPENQAPPLPFVCYFVARSNNFVADGRVYEQINVIEVELYSRRKDPMSEVAVEAVFGRADIPWEKDEAYIEDEDCVLVIYEIEV